MQWNKFVQFLYQSLPGTKFILYNCVQEFTNTNGARLISKKFSVGLTAAISLSTKFLWLEHYVPGPLAIHGRYRPNKEGFLNTQ